MAKNESVKASVTNAAQHLSYGPEVDAYVKGWVQVGQRYLWKSEMATRPIFGYPVELLIIDTNKFDKPWMCLVLQTSKETDALDAAGDTLAIPAGSQVLITYNVALHRLSEHLKDPTTVPEIMLMPTGKVIKTSKGQMKDFDIRVNPVRIARAKLGLPALHIGGSAEPAVAIPETASA